MSSSNPPSPSSQSLPGSPLVGAQPRELVMDNADDHDANNSNNHHDSDQEEDETMGPPTSRAPPATPMTNRSTNNTTINDSDDDDDDASVVPPTPIGRGNSNNTSEVASTPVSATRQGNELFGTPLTPLSPDDDDDNDNIVPAGAVDRTDDEDSPGNNDQNHNRNSNDTEWSATGGDAVIRGTNVHVPTAAAAFTDFLRNFRSLEHAMREQQQQQDDDSDDDDDDSILSHEAPPPPLYLTQLQAWVDRTLPQSQQTLHAQPQQGPVVSLDLDARHLYYHNAICQKLYHQLTAYPMELIPLFDICCQRELERLAAENNTADDANALSTIPRIQVRPFNLRKVSNLRSLDPIHMDSLVGVQGMIVRTSTILPDLKVAHFQCTLCGFDQQVAVDRGRIAEPDGKCPGCQSKAATCYQLVHNRCQFSDKQWVRLQETPDQVPAGHAPASVLVFCFDDLVDKVLPGDRVEVTAVLRAQPVRTHPKLTKLRTLYKTYLDVVHFRKLTGMQQQQKEKDTSDEPTDGAFSTERLEELQTLSRDPDIYQKLVQSLAPSIWELDNVKKGVLCMLFGGNTGQPQRNNDEENWLDEDDDDGDANGGKKHTHKRGDVNILLCGDPGTSKSQLLSYVHKMSHRGVYTSGKGSSAVGLTASVVRDPETRDLVLESGALVLSDLGICCIDEFDKMSDTTRSVLHEAMEQQTVSIAKAGIIATLHARTSVLASANPIESRYNPNRSVVDNIQLPPTLLSRFDLIYLILDTPQVESDRKLAQHLVGLYYETPNVVKPPLDQNLLRDYIQYARENIHPELSDDAANQLLDSYLEMRAGGHASRTITATPRQLESLIRLTEALAKMRYSNVATRADAQEAVRLMRVATCSTATDPRTGRIDMDLINTGRGSEAREREQQLHLAIQEIMQNERGQRLTVRELGKTIHEVTNQPVEHDDLVEALRVMEAEGLLQYNERAQSVFVRAGIGR